MKNKLKNIITFLLIIINVVIIVATIYYKKNFAEQDFETLYYNAIYSVKNANTAVVAIAAKEYCWVIILLVLWFYIPIIFNSKQANSTKQSSLKINFNSIIYALIILIICIVMGLSKIGLFEYIKNQTTTSNLFEENYSSSKNENIEMNFPKQKRNLIYIFLESMETSLMSIEDGGGWDYTLIPELAKLAKNNINFSNTQNLGGALTVRETIWTTAGMVAQTSATPIKMGIGENYYGKNSSFLPGVYTLGDILKEQGYNLEVMFGSDASFGGRKTYFEKHGDYKIFDVNTAIEQGKMTKQDKVWWGYSDDNLFEWAKDEITNLSNEDKPFNFIMLTADTHFIDGYLSENAEDIYDKPYENVFAYSSKSVYEFVKWIQEQDFYKNTTIVIVGDHQGMQSQFYKQNIKNKDYIRTVYNVFINSAIPESNSKNRQFCTLDIFPTVLASMGVKIDGERLGLGTNLFSGKKTLIEEMGYENFNKELVKKSEFYNKYLLKENYSK